MADESLFARQYIDYVYVPGFLLIVGVAIVKAEWLIYAVPVALLFGAYNFYNFRKSIPRRTVCPANMRSPAQRDAASPIAAPTNAPLNEFTTD